MKRLGSVNILNGPASFEVPAGQYGSFVLRAAGTNQAGQTLTLANLGNVSVTIGGHGYGYASFTSLNNVQALMQGLVETATAAGAAFTHTSMMPASYVGDGNVFDVARQDNIYIDVDLSGVTGVIVASGTLELYGVKQVGAQAYWPKLAMLTRNIAASSVDPVELKYDNIGFLYFDGLTNIASIRVARDGEIVVDATPAQLLAWSNWRWNPAAALTDEFLLDFVGSKLFDESLSDSFEISIETNAGGAATPMLLAVSMEPTPTTLDRSRATYRAEVNSKIKRKTNLGRVRAVGVVSRLSGSTMPVTLSPKKRR